MLVSCLYVVCWKAILSVELLHWQWRLQQVEGQLFKSCLRDIARPHCTPPAHVTHIHALQHQMPPSRPVPSGTPGRRTAQRTHSEATSVWPPLSFPRSCKGRVTRQSPCSVGNMEHTRQAGTSKVKRSMAAPTPFQRSLSVRSTTRLLFFRRSELYRIAARKRAH